VSAIFNRTIEDQMDRVIDRNRKVEAKEGIRAQAHDTIAKALAAAPDGQEAALAVSLLWNAAEAVARLHDGPRVQALLGTLADRHGKAAIPTKRDRDRARAERLFGKGEP
jgi:hypothetical protein